MGRRNAAVLLLALALFAIATNVRSGWMFLFSSLLFASVAFGIVSSKLSVRKVSLERDCSESVQEGETFTVRLTITNLRRRTSRLLTIEDRQFAARETFGPTRNRIEKLLQALGGISSIFMPPGGLREQGTSRQKPGWKPAKISVESLPGRASVTVSYEMKAPVRGVYSSALMRVTSASLTGNAKAVKDVEVDSPIKVYPKIFDVGDFPSESAYPVTGPEFFEWTRKGMGQDYFGVREYSRGDSLRYVHWKSTARHGRLIVREYQEEFRPAAGMVLFLRRSFRGNEYENSLEDGLRAAASVLSYYSRMGSLPGLIIPRLEGNEVIYPNALEDLLDALCAFEPDFAGEGPSGGVTYSERLAEALFFARSAFFAGSAVSVVTNIPRDEFILALGNLEAVENLAFVFVDDDSYGGGTGIERIMDDLDEVREASLIKAVHLYAVLQGRDISQCLSEPLNTIAA